MKAGLAANLFAFDAVRAAGFDPAGRIHFQSVVEEECTGNGALQCLLDGVRADACVLAEPHPDHLTIGQVGVLWFHVDIGGTPVHAAYAGTGHNAIEAAYAVLSELRALEAELNAEAPELYAGIPHPIHLNPGVITGGDWASTVAAQCTLSCRLAMYPGTEPAELQRRVEAAVARAAHAVPFLAGRPPRVRYDGFVCEGAVVDRAEPLVQHLSGAYNEVHGEPPALRPTTATTDARHFVRHGIPAVCFGPRAEAIHGIDERVSISSKHECAEVLARFVCRWSGVNGQGP
jgi:acetylornithine deacetylase